MQLRPRGSTDMAGRFWTTLAAVMLVAAVSVWTLALAVSLAP